eukprot:scaffold33003_cov148-Skeletonema_menzelii.AAC.1
MRQGVQEKIVKGCSYLFHWHARTTSKASKMYTGDRKHEQLTLVQKMNHALLTAITPLTLLTNPYASNALIPSFPNDSLLNLFFLLEKNDFNVPKNDDV